MSDRHSRRQTPRSGDPIGTPNIGTPNAGTPNAGTPSVGRPGAEPSIDALFGSAVALDPAAPLPPFDAAELLERQLAEIDEPFELSPAEIEGLPLGSDEPPDLNDVPWWLTDDYFGTDEAEHAAWLRGLPPDVAAAWRDELRSDDLPGAGFTHRDVAPGLRPEAGFAAGGELDVMRPGPVLAAAAYAAASRRSELGESELIGVLCAWQRLVCWAQAGQVGLLKTLVERRKEQSVELRRPTLAEHVDAEVAAALSLTGHAASRLLSASIGLAQLPCVLAALEAGRIDWAKATLFIDALTGLPDSDANDIADAVLSSADGRTTGQLRAALARAVLAYDPDAAERKQQAARKDASVQSWSESSGNACLAGRELAPADAIEASARLAALARWLRRNGAVGSTDQLRAAAFVALLTDRSLSTLLPAVNDQTPASADAEPNAAAGDVSGEFASAGGACGGGADVGAGDWGAADGGAGDWGAADGRGCEGRADDGAPDGRSARGATNRRADSRASEPLGGAINLTMPLSAWLGLTDAPGEVAGHGPADAGTCRDLAARTGPSTRWCLTLTGTHGRAVAHACASGAPPPAAAAITWAAGLREKLQYLEAGTCSHARRTSRYRPPPNLVHLIGVRQRTCSFPGCRRPARRTDLDHTRPWQRGGSTCECNLAPLCRRHHQAKQAPGWHLQQARPGEMTWQLPSGRTYQTAGEVYVC